MWTQLLSCSVHASRFPLLSVRVSLSFEISASFMSSFSVKSKSSCPPEGQDSLISSIASLAAVIISALVLDLKYSFETTTTIRSRSYEKLLRQLVPGVEITARPCPLFVPLVEAGYVDHSEAGKQQVTKLVIAQYLTEVREAGVDTLILGCTHYPLLKSMIGEFMGPQVTLVDPAMTAAHHLERMLAERGLRASHESGQAHFYVSDVPDSFVQTADLFLGEYKGGPVEQIAIDKY